MRFESVAHDVWLYACGLWRQADSDLEGLRVMSDEKEHANKGETAKVDRLHVELERLNGTLRQIEAYNEQMKGEIQVYAREEWRSREMARSETDVTIPRLLHAP
jgi:hypothetical protein